MILVRKNYGENLKDCVRKQKNNRKDLVCKTRLIGDS